MNTSKLFMLMAALNGMTCVCLGAFGAHALKSRLSEAALTTWQTSVQYQFYHAIVLLFIGLYLSKYPSNTMVWAAGMLLLGILLFSGSLYGLAIGGPRWLGPLTPLGGLSFIIAWVLLAVSVVRQ